MSINEQLAAVRVFKYIKKKTGVPDAETLDCAFTRDSIVKKFTARGGDPAAYYVFDDVAHFRKYMEIKNEYTFHEVIFDQRQKLKFDIDMDGSTIGAFECIDANGDIVNGANKWKNIIDTISETILTTLLLTWGINHDESQLVICETTDGTSRKLSAHIIVDGLHALREDARAFCLRVCSYLPPQYAAIIDRGVYSTIQCFRAPECHKLGQPMRIKRITSGHTYEHALITWLDGCIELPTGVFVHSKSVEKTTTTTDNINRVLDIVHDAGLDVDHKFVDAVGGLFVFKRTRPGHCDICSRVHEHDNTLLVSISPDAQNDHTMNVWRRCRRSDVSIKIGSYIDPSIAATTVGAPAAADDVLVRAIVRQQTTPTLHQNNELRALCALPGANIYAEPVMRAFENAHTLLIRAPMKIGKTKALSEHIRANFADGVVETRAVFVSFRQTFGADVKAKFPGFTLYSDVRGDLRANKLIIQVESLHRLAIDDVAPDLLILDECEAIFEQFGSGLIHYPQRVWAVFKWLMTYSRHVICMDANLSSRTYEMVRVLRGLTGCVFHFNEYKNAADDVYALTSDTARWYGALYAAVERGERVVVATNSIAEGKTLARVIGARLVDKQVRLYSSETQPSEKRAHFADVNKFWSELDVLIYTPTVTAGVSFELKHFNKVFGYFTDQSCCVETCQQMIGRIRDVASHKFYICIVATGNTLPIEPSEIKRRMHTSRDNLMNQYDDTLLTFDYGANGDVQYHASAYFELWVQNTRVKNLSRVSFARRFVDILSAYGAQMIQFTPELYEAETGAPLLVDGGLTPTIVSILEEQASTRTIIKQEHNIGVAMARELDEEELATVDKIRMAQGDLTREQTFGWELSRLRRDYKFSHEITEAWVATYSPAKKRANFRNLNQISACRDPERALAQIQAEEAAYYKYNMQMGESAQQTDINRRYMFDKHRIALGLIKLCGFTGLRDPRAKSAAEILQRAAGRDMTKIIFDACAEFTIKRPATKQMSDDQIVATIVGITSKILDILYGAKIAKNAHAGIYLIEHSKLFTNDATSRTQPVLRQPVD